MRIGRNVDELRRDAYLISGLAHTAFENVVDVEHFRDRAHIRVRAFDRERRRSRRDAQTRNVRERVEQLFGDTVAKILLFGIGADAHERQHGERVPWSGLRLRRERPIACGALGSDGCAAAVWHATPAIEEVIAHEEQSHYREYAERDHPVTELASRASAGALREQQS